jgi:outer membrane protein TolC
MNSRFAGLGPRPWSIFFSTACARARHRAAILARDAARGAAALSAAALVAALLPAPGASAEGEARISLAEALRLAEENALQVKAAEHDSLSAEHGLRAAKDAWFPTFGVTGNAFGFHPQDPLGIGPLALPADWSEVYATNLRLNYPIYTGGRRGNDIRRQRESLDATSSQISTERLANAYESRRAYIGLLIADRMVDSANASLARVTLIRTHVGNLHAAGMADSLDILEAEISLSGARRLVEEARGERKNASAALSRLLAFPGDETIVPTEFIPDPEPPSAEPPAIGDIAGRPELSTASHQIESARYQKSIVNAGYLPVVNGMGGYALVKPNIGERESDWQDIWWLGLTLSWDLNLGGQEFSRSKQASEAVRSLEMRRKDLEDTLLLQARIAWNNIGEAYNIYAIRRDEYNLASRRFALAVDVQKAGRMTVNRLLELETDLTQTQQQYEAARLQYHAAVTDYLYAVGSGAIREGF